MDRFERRVELACPMCGSTNWTTEENGFNDFEESPDDHVFKCSYCNGSFTKNTLIEGNQELINNTVQELANDFIEDSVKDLEKTIKRINRKLK